jgi:hypothetical protein
MVIHCVLLIASAILLAGCDTAFRVRGEAPVESSCRLALLENGKELYAQPVSGRFENTFVSGVCCTARKLQAICDGKVIKEIVEPFSFSGGRDPFNQPHELGILAP